MQLKSYAAKIGRAILRMVITFLVVYALLTIWFQHFAAAGQIEVHAGQVTRVIDGDTIILNGDERVRITCIDAPELAQPYGPHAWAFASSRLFGRTVAVHAVARDRYGRLLGRVKVRGKDFSAAIVAAGLAWAACKELRALEAEARAARRGLWAQDAPIRPQDYRRANKAEK